ncbi:MAG: hypothetical protein R6X25_03425 [Candidatus Krumholzibacteriia bacterium]
MIRGRLPTPRPGPAIVAAAGLLVLACATAPSPATDAARAAALDDGKGPVRLHPSLPETLTVEHARRFGMYTEVPGLERFWFRRAPWGGYLTRLETRGPGGPRLRERSVPQARWRQFQDRVEAVLAGASPPDSALAPAPPWVEDRRTGAPADSVAAGRSGGRLQVWPEAPLPPQTHAGARPEEPPLEPPFRNRWLSLLEAGYRHNISDFDAFFTGMLQFGLAFGYTATERLVPYAAFTVGFGDIRSDFEAIAGEGRANAYNFALGSVLRQPVSRRGSLYVAVEGGYYVRALQWGGLFENPFTGQVREGYILEQQHWGGAVRLGFLRQTAHEDKLRAWDLGVTLQRTAADPWVYFDDDRIFAADDQDTWLVVSLRFWDSL